MLFQTPATVLSSRVPESWKWHSCSRVRISRLQLTDTECGDSSLVMDQISSLHFHLPVPSICTLLLIGTTLPCGARFLASFHDNVCEYDHSAYHGILAKTIPSVSVSSISVYLVYTRWRQPTPSVTNYVSCDELCLL